MHKITGCPGSLLSYLEKSIIGFLIAKLKAEGALYGRQFLYKCFRANLGGKIVHNMAEHLLKVIMIRAPAGILIDPHHF